MENVISLGSESPGVLLRRLLDDEKSIKRLIVCIARDEAEDGVGAVETFWTTMTVGNMVYMYWALGKDIDGTLMSEA